MLSFSIVIVNWNSGILLQKCIASVYQSDRYNCLLDKVIIVDNASTDNSLADIGLINLPIKIVLNKKNFGFGRACNIGAEGLNSDFILFLNPDTIIITITIFNMFEQVYKRMTENNCNGI